MFNWWQLLESSETGRLAEELISVSDTVHNFRVTASRGYMGLGSPWFAPDPAGGEEHELQQGNHHLLLLLQLPHPLLPYPTTMAATVTLRF